MEKISVCVTGIGGSGVGEQIVKALRLADTSYHITGTDISIRSTGFSLVDTFETLPAASQKEYLPLLLDICKKHQVKAIFPGSEPELKFLSKHREQVLSEDILLFLNSPDVIDICLDKLQTFHKLHEMGFSVPFYKSVKNVESVEDIDIFPLVFKPSVGGGGSVDTLIVQNREEAILFAKYLLGIYPEFIAQEYWGTSETEFTACVLCDFEGNYINSIALHRDLSSALSRRLRVPNRTGRNELGEFLVISSGISQGRIGRFPLINDYCRRIADGLESKGPLNVQCRVMGDEVCVFEINPRFSGTTAMRAMMGFNEPDLLVRRHLLGQKITPDFSYQEGFINRRLIECLCE